MSNKMSNSKNDFGSMTRMYLKNGIVLYHDPTQKTVMRNGFKYKHAYVVGKKIVEMKLIYKDAFISDVIPVQKNRKNTALAKLVYEGIRITSGTYNKDDNWVPVEDLPKVKQETGYKPQREYTPHVYFWLKRRIVDGVVVGLSAWRKIRQ